MKTRIISACVMIPLLIAVVFFLPPWAMAVLLAVITGVGAFELLRAVKYTENVRALVYASLSGVLIMAATYFGIAEEGFIGVLFLLIFAMFLEGVLAYGTKPKPGFFEILCAVFGGAVIPYFLSMMLRLKMLDHSGIYAIMPFVCTAISDSGGYFVGKYLGKHRGILKVSPNKTLEGFAGSLISGIIGLLLYGLILQLCAKLDVNYPLLILYGILGNAATQVGDLAFSLIKRQNGIKDYGKLIPGHGGVLDRLDSAIFTMPVMYILVTLLPAF